MTNNPAKWCVGDTVTVQDANTFDGSLFKGVIVEVKYTKFRKNPVYAVRFSSRNYSIITREATYRRELKWFPERKLYSVKVYDVTP